MRADTVEYLEPTLRAVVAIGDVRAVVLETTGHISVLHGPVEGPAVAEVLLSGVRRTRSVPQWGPCPDP